MSSKKTAIKVAGFIYNPFADVSYKQDLTHLVYYYATSQFTNRQLILNDPITFRVVVISSKQKATIISLPQYYLDIATEQKSLVGLLGNSCSYTTLVMLIENFARDLLTLAPTNTKLTNQLPIGATATCEIPDSYIKFLSSFSFLVNARQNKKVLRMRKYRNHYVLTILLVSSGKILSTIQPQQPSPSSGYRHNSIFS